jgi:hypothetical protein
MAGRLSEPSARNKSGVTAVVPALGSDAVALLVYKPHKSKKSKRVFFIEFDAPSPQLQKDKKTESL